MEFYALRSEFQIKGSPHIHSFIRIFNALSAQNVAVYIDFIDETINSYLLDHLSNPKLCELVKTYQICAQSKNRWKYSKIKCCFSYGQYFTNMIMIRENHLIINLAMKKRMVLTRLSALLWQVKSYIDDNQR